LKVVRKGAVLYEEEPFSSGAQQDYLLAENTLTSPASEVLAQYHYHHGPL